MIKKWLLTFLLCGFFVNLQGSENPEMKQILDQIVFVLFALEDNTVRMEYYRLSDLSQDISKDISDSHCLFTMDMTQLSAGPYSIVWNEDVPGCMNIVAGQENTPMVYHLLLNKLMPAIVQSESPMPLYCDCSVTPLYNPQNKKIESSVSVSLSSGEDSAVMELVFEEQIDAACSFLIQHDMLENGTVFSGKVGMQKALDEGVLVVAHKADKAFDKDTETFFARIKQMLLARLITIKDFLSFLS